MGERLLQKTVQTLNGREARYVADGYAHNFCLWHPTDDGDLVDE